MFEIIFLIIASLLFGFLARKLSNPGVPAFVFFIVIGFYFLITGTNQYKENWRVNHVYQQTNCTVTKQISYVATDIKPTNNSFSFSYSSSGDKELKPILCPSVLLRYLVNNEAFEIPLRLNCTDSKDVQTQILSGYQVGQVIPCLYDPKDYSKIILSREDVSIFTYILIGLGLFLIITVTYRFNYPKKEAGNKIGLTNTIDAIKQEINGIPENRNFNTTIKNDDPLVTQPNTIAKNKPIDKTSILMILAICICFSALTYKLLKDQLRVDYYFKPATCTILDVKVDNNSSGRSNTYKTRFLASYQVGGETLTSWITSTIDKVNTYSSFGNESGEYTVNKQYPCWYDPDKPDVAVLSKGYSFIIYLVAFIDSLLLFSLIRVIKSWNNAKKK